jgi:hypothetical protein
MTSSLGKSASRFQVKQEPQRRGGSIHSSRTLLIGLSHLITAVLAFSLGSFYGSELYECTGVVQSLDLAPRHHTGTQDTLPVATSQSFQERLFPEGLQGLFVGAGRVTRDDFAASLDLGIPVPVVDNQQVLLLYMSPNSLPVSQDTSSRTGIPLYSVADATANCHTLKVVLTATDNNKGNSDGICLAIMGQHNSHHVHTWTRKKSYNNKPKALLRPSSLIYNPPKPVSIRAGQTVMTNYFSVVDQVLVDLQPVVQKVAEHESRSSTSIVSTAGKVLVMVCNWGHTELLMNFVCAARAVGMNTGNILLFATDPETVQLAESLGLAAFYDARIFASIPVEAAKSYGTMDYAAIMMSKVFCVHLVNLAGYDLLFQDVDIVPHRPDYFEYLLATVEAQPGFDLYLQYDPSPNPLYAPWEANSGFYYARRNGKTNYLFSTLVRMADLILRTKSHQATLTQVLSEHAVLYGLRSKVLYAQRDDFPVGFHFHKKSEFMKEMMKGKRKPYIFHMNWNLDKETKRQFNEQIGDWFVDDKCIGKSVKEIAADGSGSVADTCCISSPTIVCHYRDKPSKIPCRESPPADAEGKSFW